MKARCLPVYPLRKGGCPKFSDHVGEMSGSESITSKTGPTGAPCHLAVVHAGFELHEGADLEAKRDFITQRKLRGNIGNCKLQE